jgi:hypothetical protein
MEGRVTGTAHGLGLGSVPGDSPVGPARGWGGLWARGRVDGLQWVTG